MKIKRPHALLALLLIAIVLLLAANVFASRYILNGAYFARDELIPRFFREPLPDNVLHALESATSMETCLVDDSPQSENPAVKADFVISDKRRITTPEELNRLANLIEKGVDEGRLPKLFHLSFHPKYGVQFRDAEQTHILLLCFDCNQLRILSGTKTFTQLDRIFYADFETVRDLFPSTP